MDKVLAALTHDLVGGFNLLSVIGFLVMGLGLTQSRQGRSRAPLAFGLMAVGTVLVFVGIYFGHHPL
ncbi:MAG TPA: hypothetical protein VET89_05595 [Stellaceae bacterium]|jgi:hypothetical protein|nr:hypothetical protein [Stellaceae bacterium]